MPARNRPRFTGDEALAFSGRRGYQNMRCDVGRSSAQQNAHEAFAREPRAAASCRRRRYHYIAAIARRGERWRHLEIKMTPCPRHAAPAAGRARRIDEGHMSRRSPPASGYWLASRVPFHEACHRMMQMAWGDSEIKKHFALFVETGGAP